MKHIILLLVLSLCSCSIDPVNDLKRPVTVVACNESGLILQGADGQVLVYDSNFYIAKIAYTEKLKPGAVLAK